MAIYLKRPASYFNTMLRRIEHFSRRLGVTAPVTKVRQRGGFVLSLNTDFAQAYSAIRSP
jgi:hypothetical protein